MSAPAVSVIVPVYNVEEHLTECLDSIAAQSFVDFEVIVVDDGSTDGSHAIAARYVAADPGRFRLLAKANGGLGDARNAGLAHASGAYLAFVDGDDALAPTMLERMHTYARETGADLVICGIDNFTEGEGSARYYPEPDMSVFGRSLAEEPMLLYRVDASACNKLYARGLFERAGVLFPVGLAFEDLPTVYRLLPHAHRVEKIDEPLYRYRHARAESITARYDERFLDLVEGFRLVDESYATAGILEQNREGLLRLHLTHLIAGRYPDFLPEAEPDARRTFVRATFDLLDGRFAGWRASPVVRALWRSPLLRLVSTRSWLLLVFCRLPRRAFFGVLARTGAFDPMR